MVRKLERAPLPNTGSDRENNMSEEVRPRRISPRTIEEQRKARALLRDLVDAGDAGLGWGNMISGPHSRTPGGTVEDALGGLDEAGAIHHSSGAWHATYLGQLADAHARAAGLV